MNNKYISIKKGAGYILAGGAVLFLAVFLGIQAGFAIGGGRGGTSEITPETLLNDSLMERGEIIPSLQVRDVSGELYSIQNITRGRKTVITLVMSDCNPCKKLLTIWRRNEVFHDPEGVQVILLAVGSLDDTDLGKLAEFTDRYPVYFCDVEQLANQWGIMSFPNAVGVGSDNSISFIACAQVHRLDNRFFAKYL